MEHFTKKTFNWNQQNLKRSWLKQNHHTQFCRVKTIKLRKTTFQRNQWKMKHYILKNLLGRKKGLKYGQESRFKKNESNSCLLF